jgi:hypothetical protein
VSSGNSRYCGAAQAQLPFTIGDEVDAFSAWLDISMSRAGWTKVGEIPKTGDARGQGTHWYRRGHREWAATGFEYASSGRVERLSDHRYHGTISYSIAPYPCNGDHGCGDWMLVFRGSLGS